MLAKGRRAECLDSKREVEKYVEDDRIDPSQVWQFTKQIMSQGSAAWDKGSGFGEVPVKWDVGQQAWVAGNRHRVVNSQIHVISISLEKSSTHTLNQVIPQKVAALVAGVPFSAKCKQSQVFENSEAKKWTTQTSDLY